jgi:hypothetical protein
MLRALFHSKDFFLNKIRFSLYINILMSMTRFHGSLSSIVFFSLLFFLSLFIGHQIDSGNRLFSSDFHDDIAYTIEMSIDRNKY